MGIYSGAVTLCRYRLVGYEGKTLKKINQKLKTYQAQEVKLVGQEKEERYGWVLPLGGAGYHEDRQAGDYWDMADCQFGDGYFLRMRVERRKVSSELLQLVFSQRLKEETKERDRPFSRKAQKALKEEVKAMLLEKSLPAISYIDAYWHDDGQIMLFSTGKKNRANFEELFGKTFAKPLGGRLMRVEPPLLGMAPKDWEVMPAHDGIERIAKLLPTTFVQPEVS